MRFRTAREQLGLQIPNELPGREAEVAKIYDRLSTCINQDISLTMYISGEPGTGKTATVTKVLHTILAERQASELSSFHICLVNAMSLPSPKDIYAHVWQVIAPPTKKKKAKKQEIPKKVAEFFTMRKRTANARAVHRNRYTVIVIDELDYLVTRDQKIIYEFMDWPQKENSRLAVIGIANTVSLPEQLMDKIANRMHTTERIIFKTYTQKEIETILLKRLEGTDVFDTKALKIVAHRIASSSGDIRRGLDICRRAAELKEETIHIEEAHVSDVEHEEEEQTIDDANHQSAVDTDEPMGDDVVPTTIIRSRKDIVRKRRNRTGMSQSQSQRLDTEKVTLNDIQHAFEELFATELYPIVQLPIYHKLFLWCARLESLELKDDQSELKVENIISRVQTLLRKSTTIAEVTMFEMLPVVNCLLGMNLIVNSTKSDKDRYPSIELATSNDDIEQALSEDLEMKTFISL